MDSLYCPEDPSPLLSDDMALLSLSYPEAPSDNTKPMDSLQGPEQPSRLLSDLALLSLSAPYPEAPTDNKKPLGKVGPIRRIPNNNNDEPMPTKLPLQCAITSVGTPPSDDLVNQKEYNWLNLPYVQILFVVRAIPGDHSFSFMNADTMSREILPTEKFGVHHKTMLWWNLSEEQRQLVRSTFTMPCHLFRTTTVIPSVGPLTYDQVAAHFGNLVEDPKPSKAGASPKKVRFSPYSMPIIKRYSVAMKKLPRATIAPFQGFDVQAEARHPDTLASEMAKMSVGTKEVSEAPLAAEIDEEEHVEMESCEHESGCLQQGSNEKER